MTPFRRLLRDHRIIWWILGVSFLLAWLGSLPARTAFGAVLDHSQASLRLVQGFDFSAWAELTNAPEVPMGALVSASLGPMLVFLIYLVFLAGGTYAAYGADRPLSTGAFFQACGAHFWRMTRLTLVSLLPFGLLGGAFGLFRHLTSGLGDSPNERASVYALLAGLLVAGLLMLFVRAWFDLAQARTVARSERGMFKTALRTFRLVSVRLYVAYVGLAFLRLAGTALALWLWTRIPAGSMVRSFLALEAVVLVHIVTRLWQRASAVAALEAGR